ncbi:transcription initiation factor TFIID subunit 8 [Anabrus simplex]|uniref:transcription initiation factor TFIID subunit 8 n=1 Tax=Anabrus simplex TaxID=316456 RepID=UPI0035A2FD9A
MGLTLEGIESYAYRPYRMIFENPETEKEPTRVSLLHVGHKEKRAPYITKNMPRYPDLHTYRRTPCIKMPVIDKSKLLIKKTEERRCIERAMINLKMKNKVVDTLYFPHHPNLYPLIPCTTSVPAYLSALQPSDQSYANDTENSSDMDEEVDNPYLYPARLSKKETVK